MSEADLVIAPLDQFVGPRRVFPKQPSKRIRITVPDSSFNVHAHILAGCERNTALGEVFLGS
jgi:hypothetical protein